MTVTDDLLANNARYAETFDKGDLPLPPGLGLAVVACMDARLDPHRLLGISEGDAHVIRDAGGVVTDDAIRSLVGHPSSSLQCETVSSKFRSTLSPGSAAPYYRDGPRSCRPRFPMRHHGRWSVGARRCSGAYRRRLGQRVPVWHASVSRSR